MSKERAIAVVILLLLFTWPNGPEVHSSAFAGGHFIDNPLDLVVLDWDQQVLRKKGYSIDTTEKLEQIWKSERGYVKDCALRLLAAKLGQKAIPLLRDVLTSDPERFVRINMAKALWHLGDKSGLAQMQKDYAALMRAVSAAEANLAGVEEAEKQRANRNLRYWTDEALTVAEVLADFGDLSGFDLAAKVALDPNIGAYVRISAYKVLFEISMEDPILLAKEGRDPGEVLIKAAEKEADELALGYLVRGAQLYDRQDTRRMLLEKLLASPHVIGKTREDVNLALKWLDEEQKRAREKLQSGQPSSGG